LFNVLNDVVVIGHFIEEGTPRCGHPAGHNLFKAKSFDCCKTDSDGEHQNYEGPSRPPRVNVLGSTGGLRKPKKVSGVGSSSKAATFVEDFTGRPKLVAHHLPPAGVGCNQDEPTYGTVPLPNHLQRNKAHVKRKDDENLLNIMAYDPNTFPFFSRILLE